MFPCFLSYVEYRFKDMKTEGPYLGEGTSGEGKEQKRMMGDVI
jgi:hypothetical protein